VTAVPTLNRDQAATLVQAAVSERDTIQQNLLDLDGSFGKRLLAGAKLTGGTKRRWEAASADLATLWDTFSAYSAVIDRAAEIMTGLRRSPGPQLAQVSSLLYAPSVQLSRPSSALSRGDITSSGVATVTVFAAVRDMKAAFATVADVVAAAEAVWNEAADQVQQIGTDIAAARQQAGGMADEAFTGLLTAVETELGQIRDLINCDPLALWQGGRVDTSRLGRLKERVAAATSRAADLAALRANSGRRIEAVAAVVATARQAWQDAMAARQRAAAKIAVAALPAPPNVSGLAPRLASLNTLAAEGRWTRLDSELDLLDKQAAALAKQCRDTEQQAAALLDRREELRGLLDAYRARAAKLGGAEDSDLDARYDRARDLLWTAPCDLPAATDAVTGYQRAVLALRATGSQNARD
jgi:chromosome segregation ATPase